MAGSCSSGTSNLSNKPWFLTEVDGDVLIWRNNVRLKVAGKSTGCVTEVSHPDGILLLRGMLNSTSQTYKFKCELRQFCAESNEFCQKLKPFCGNLHQFCAAVSKFSKGSVHYARSEDSEKQESAPKSVKKRKGMEETEVDDLSSFLIGTYQIPIELLQEPPPYLQIRELKSWYIEYLMDMLSNSEGDHEDLTAPLLVIASVKQAEFKVSHMDKYTYQVIGGMQRFKAITLINAKGTRKILSRKCCVYGASLPRKTLLMLARQHNDINEIQRETTFAEVAASCRRLLFLHFGDKNLIDDGEYMPSIPRYNTQKYKEYKQECVAYLHSPKLSIVYIETAIQMALQSPQVYHCMQKVFSLFEDGELNGQRVKSRESAVGRKKALQGHYSPKAHHFKMFQGLQDEGKLEVLMALLSKKISWSEASNRISEIKAPPTMRESTTEEPQPSQFKNVCERAKDSQVHTEEGNIESIMETQMSKTGPSNCEEVLTLDNVKITVSRCGESAQLAVQYGMDCVCVQLTEEGATNLASTLSHPRTEENPNNTEELLQELSEAEKLAQNLNSEGNVKYPLRNRKRPLDE